MKKISHIQSLLRQAATIPLEKRTMFFKAGAGHYAEHDHFIGVTVPAIRRIAKDFKDLSLEQLQVFLASSMNEERLFALIIAAHHYQCAPNGAAQDALYQWYVRNMAHVNNWNLVDSSAHLIIGAHLFARDRSFLVTLAQSQILWERRISIVSTWYFIRQNDLEWTFKLATILLNDRHDLIHKAVGWMLREAGKRDQTQLILFLNKYAGIMPRTMLRYAIERLPVEMRQGYLKTFITDPIP